MPTAKEYREQAEQIMTRSRQRGKGLTPTEEAEFDRLHALADKAGSGGTTSDRTAKLAALLEREQRTPTTLSAGYTRPAPVVATLGSDEYRVAFATYLRTGHREQVLADGTTAFKAAALQTDFGDKGGYLAPPQFVADVIRLLDDRSPIRQRANVLPPTNAVEVERPTRTSGVSALAWTSEIAAPTPDSSMAFGKRVMTPHHLAGEFEVARGVLLAGAERAVVGEIVYDAALIQEQAFVAGTGERQPIGLFPVSDQGIPSSRNITGNPTLAATWTALIYSLKARYTQSPSAAVVMHRDALKVILAIDATTLGVPLYVAPMRDGEPGRLLGLPVILSEYAPQGTDVGSAYQSGDAIAVAGDLSCYDIVDSAHTSVRRFDDSYYGRRGMTGFMFRSKTDGCPRVAEAFSRLVVA